MFLDKIIVINLDIANERKKRIINSFNRINLNLNDVIFLPAFDANHLNNFFERSLHSHNMNRTFAKGELCCTLSHILAIKLSKAMGYKNVLILEDDVEICDDFLNRLNVLESQLPTDWNQVYIGGMTDLNNLQHYSNNMYRINKLDGTHSYILNHNSFDTVVEQMLSFSSATDGEYEILRMNGKINAYAFIPFFTYQTDNYSYICNEDKDMYGPSHKNFANRL